MKKNESTWFLHHVGGFRSIVIAVFIVVCFTPVSSQDSVKGEAGIERQKLQVERAQLAHERQEKRIALADSLIISGNATIEASSEVIKFASATMKVKN